MPEQNETIATAIIDTPQEAASKALQAVKTTAQLVAEKRQKELTEAKAARVKAAADLKAKRDTLKLNVGKSFSDGERDGIIVAFEPDKMLGSLQGDAFLVNFGNPCRSDYYFCETFLATFKGKE
jgi:hypothetical protein